MCENRFFICRHCGNLVGLIEASGVPMICCGEPMEQLVPNQSDGAVEKHLPVVKIEGNKVHVSVGEVEHPMSEEHSIHWVYLQNELGGHRKCLLKETTPVCDFLLIDEKPVAVYSYCNLHGLYRTDL